MIFIRLIRGMLAGILFVLTLLGELGAQTKETTSSINGVIHGNDGSVISDVIVTLIRMPPFANARRLKTEWITKSGADGSYSFANLPPAKYRLCAFAEHSDWLNPCQWGPRAADTDISGVRQSIVAPILLERGVRLQVQVEDPGALIFNPESPGHLLLGVTNDAFAFIPAVFHSQTTSTTIFSLLLPYSSHRSLKLSSNTATLLTPSGALALGLTGQLDVFINSAQVAPVVLLTAVRPR